MYVENKLQYQKWTMICDVPLWVNQVCIVSVVFADLRKSLISTHDQRWPGSPVYTYIFKKADVLGQTFWSPWNCMCKVSSESSVPRESITCLFIFFSPGWESCDTKCEFLLNTPTIYFCKGRQFCLRVFFTPVLPSVDLLSPQDGAVNVCH